MEFKLATLKKIGRRGDVQRAMIWFVILLIMLVLILALFLGGAYTMVKSLFFNWFFS